MRQNLVIFDKEAKQIYCWQTEFQILGQISESWPPSGLVGNPECTWRNSA